MNIFLLLLLILVLFLSLYSLWKIRKVHLLLFQLKDSIQHLSEVKLQDLLKQTQCLSRLEKNLDISSGTLPPAWGWTALPDLLEIIAEEALKPEVKACLECGSGLSTVVTALSLKKKGEGKVYSLEHSKEAKESTEREIRKLSLENFAEVLYSPLKKQTFNNKQYNWYDLEEHKNKIPKNIDLLFIDGPPVNTSKLARFPALKIFSEKLSRNALIILDDGIREEEQEIASLWENEFSGLKKIFNLTERKAIIYRMN